MYRKQNDFTIIKVMSFNYVKSLKGIENETRIILNKRIFKIK